MPAEDRRGEQGADGARCVPRGALNGLIAAYDGYLEEGMSPARHLGLPSPFMTVIVSLYEPLDIARHIDPRRPPARYDSLVGGLHSTPVVIAHEGAQSGVQLRVSPLASRALFGVPAGELAQTDVAADEVLGTLAGELHERLAAAASWAQRFTILDERLGRRLRDDRAPPAVVQAWRLLLMSRGTMTVADLSREVGYSQRHLTDRFREEIGLTPKRAGRVIRFHHARQALKAQLAAGGGTDIARVAADCGYHDQSHLVRDFHSFSGLAPSRWLRQEFRNVQAPRPVDA